MKRIFLVEDDKEIAKNLALLLRTEGFNVTHASSQSEAISVLDGNRFDLALVDISLPDGNGFTVCTEIKQAQNIPVIFLTASGDEASVVTGLNMGADDYIIKPFRPRDLELRILSILKRAYPEKEDTLVLPACQVHFSQALITKGKLEIQLTAKEYSILKVLYDNKNRIVTFDQLLEKVWGLQYQGYDNTLMAHIRKIRQKIEANPSKPESLITVKGLGYKLKVN